MAHAPHARYGVGSLSELGPNKWRLQAFAGTEPISGKRRNVTKTFHGTKRQATQALADLQREANSLKAQVQHGRPSRLTLGGLLDRWLDFLAPESAPTTIAEYQRKIEHDIKPELGPVPLSKLTVYDLDRFYTTMLKKGLSPTTVGHFHSIIRAALNQAETWGWIASNPARKTKKWQAAKIAPTMPSVEELRALIVKAQEEQRDTLATAVALAALTGCRRGELCALRWSDVDMVGGILHVRRSVSTTRSVGATVSEEQRQVAGRRPTKTIHEGPTKTHLERDLPLDHVTLDVLRDRWAYQADLSERAGVPLVTDPYVLAVEPSGRAPIMPDTLTDGFRRLSNGKFRFHDLRHWMATEALAHGMPVIEVSKRLGHSKVSTTVDIYGHPTTEGGKELARVMGELLRGE